MDARDEFRRRAKAAYRELVASRPGMFENPAGAEIRVLLDEAEAVEAEDRVRRAGRMDTDLLSDTTGVLAQAHGFMVLHDAVAFAGGERGTYLRLVPDAIYGAAVAVLPRLGGDFVLLEHFRHATRRVHLEIPRGSGRAGVPSESEARRELLEEMGGKAERVVSLGTLYPDTGLSAIVAELYLADLTEIGEPQREEGVRRLRRVSLEELEDLARTGELSDSFALAALTRARLRGLL